MTAGGKRGRHGQRLMAPNRSMQWSIPPGGSYPPAVAQQLRLVARGRAAPQHSMHSTAQHSTADTAQHSTAHLHCQPLVYVALPHVPRATSDDGGRVVRHRRSKLVGCVHEAAVQVNLHRLIVGLEATNQADEAEARSDTGALSTVGARPNRAGRCAAAPPTRACCPCSLID